MSMVSGYDVVAKSLAQQGLTHVFGIVGIPVTDLGSSFQAEGMNYFGFRNEQAASYAAGIVGYLNKRPGVCLAVSGPGMTNCISGMAEALINKRPMILLGGAPDSTLEGRGGFQELDQIAAAKPVCKYAARPHSVKHIPVIIERAVRISMYGTPGPCYIDLPSDVLYAQCKADEVIYCPRVEPLPQLVLPDTTVKATLNLLKSAKSPLVIVGKGIAYGDAQDEMRAFVDKSNLPFLATPMGKGVVSDDDNHNAGRARSFILQNADVIFLCGARLNWILHFGLPPRFRADVKIIQLDNDPQEFHTNVKAALPLCGDAKTILGQLSSAVSEELHSSKSEWWTAIRAKSDKNKKEAEHLFADKTVPMNYYSSIGIVQDQIAKNASDFILVAEGSNTMDIGRTILMNTVSKQRLDAGTFGTMGVGFGFAIAAQSLYPKKKVVMVVGDSAFGFSGMELETAARYKLPLKVVIINNNGIVFGTEEIDEKGDPNAIPVFHLSPGARYELMAEAFGGKGRCVKTHEELAQGMKEMLADNNLWVLNVKIDPYANKKPQSFSWLSRSDDVDKKDDGNEKKEAKL